MSLLYIVVVHDNYHIPLTVAYHYTHAIYREEREHSFLSTLLVMNGGMLKHRQLVVANIDKYIQIYKTWGSFVPSYPKTGDTSTLDKGESWNLETKYRLLLGV